jgi:hypothetical protein
MAGKFGLNELFTTTQEEDHEGGFSNATSQNNEYGDELKTTINLLNIPFHTHLVIMYQCHATLPPI